MSESHKLIDAALTSLREVYQEDTDTTVKRLDSLRQANTTATLRYIKKEEELKKLVRKSDTVKANNNELEQLKESLTSVENRLISIEQLVEELDKFTAEW